MSRAASLGDWPLATIYVTLFLLALAWIAVWVLHDSGQLSGAWIATWAPHGASVAAELFIATVVVGGLLKRHERTELEPLRETAILRLRLALAGLMNSVAVQYAFAAPDGSELPEEWTDLVRAWLGQVPDSYQSWLAQWFRELDRFSAALEAIRDRYEQELDPLTVSVADGFLHHWHESEGLRLRSTYELGKGIASALGLPTPDTRRITRQQLELIQAIVRHAVGVCERFEAISSERIQLDAHAREQFRLAQVARRAVVSEAGRG